MGIAWLKPMVLNCCCQNEWVVRQHKQCFSNTIDTIAGQCSWATVVEIPRTIVCRLGSDLFLYSDASPQVNARLLSGSLNIEKAFYWMSPVMASHSCDFTTFSENQWWRTFTLWYRYDVRTSPNIVAIRIVLCTVVAGVPREDAMPVSRLTERAASPIEAQPARHTNIHASYSIYY